MKSNNQALAHRHATIALNLYRCGQDKQARQHWELAKAHVNIILEARHASDN